jgi:hypothetical protein
MFTLSPVTTEQVAKLKTHFNLTGTQIEPITPNTTPGKYQISDGKVHLVAQFEPDQQALHVTVVKKPFYVFESHIKVGLQTELQALTPPAPPAAAKAGATPPSAPPPVKPAGEPLPAGEVSTADPAKVPA